MADPIASAPPPPKKKAGIVDHIFTLLAVGLGIALVVVVLQRVGVLGGVPLDAAVKAAVSGSVPTMKPNPKNMNAYAKEDDPKLQIEDIGPNKWKIVNVHEHAQNEEEAARLVKSMERFGVQRTCLQAATIYTFTLNNKYGFEEYTENNDAIIGIKQKWPDRFCAFITFQPGTDDVQYVKDYVKKGADGVKLYLGHGAATGKGPFHVMPLDDPRLEPFWAFAEETQLPVLIHVNLTKYWDETVSLLEKHPNLRLCLPHFGLHKNTEPRLKRLGWILDRYPNTFTDVSYGYYTFQVEGFEALAKWRSRSQAFMKRYADRILFASDMVLEKTKDDAYIDNTLRSYRQFHEMDKFRLFIVPTHTMLGLNLDDKTLKTIYEEAPARYLLLDQKGALPDRRSEPRVAVNQQALPPIDLESIPDDPQYQPRDPREGPAYAAAVSLARHAGRGGRGGAAGAGTEGGGGESPEDTFDPDDSEAKHACPH